MYSEFRPILLKSKSNIIAQFLPFLESGTSGSSNLNSTSADLSPPPAALLAPLAGEGEGTLLSEKMYPDT
jgi:hypothetical protein